MAENSSIEWTTHTFNPWLGCTKVNTGCTNCYAETLMDKRYGKVQWGPHGTRVRTSGANWRKPLQWDRAAAKAGERHRVFCASLADVFEDWQGPIVNAKKEQLFTGPNILNATSRELHAAKGMGAGARATTMDDQRRDLFAMIDATPNLDWLLLTKRPENVRRLWPRGQIGPYLGIRESGVGVFERRNVWLGTSISDQATADQMIPELLKCRDLSPVLFLSVEPIVGPIDLQDIPDGDSFIDSLASNKASADWVIVGGESGVGRRRIELEWARLLRDQCESAGVPFFMKQIDKVQPIPDDLMIRQFPAATEPAGT